MRNIAVVLSLAAALCVPATHAIQKGTLLEEIDRAWKEIDDFSAVLLQQQRISRSEPPRSFVGWTRMVRPSAIRIDSREISNTQYADALAHLDASPLIEYASEESVWYNGRYWYRYLPSERIVYREATLTLSFLPFLAMVAGFTEEDVRELHRTHHIGAPREMEVLGQACYRLRLEPRMGQAAEYRRIDFWVDRKDYLPVRVLVNQGVAEMETCVLAPRVNQGLEARSLELRVPRGVERRDRD